MFVCSKSGNSPTSSDNKAPTTAAGKRLQPCCRELEQQGALCGETAGTNGRICHFSARAAFAPNNNQAEQLRNIKLAKIQSGMIADFLTVNKNGDIVALYEQQRL